MSCSRPLGPPLSPPSLGCLREMCFVFCVGWCGMNENKFVGVLVCVWGGH
jgi:hypothetical protein